RSLGRPADGPAAEADLTDFDARLAELAVLHRAALYRQRCYSRGGLKPVPAVRSIMTIRQLAVAVLLLIRVPAFAVAWVHAHDTLVDAPRSVVAMRDQGFVIADAN